MNVSATGPGAVCLVLFGSALGLLIQYWVIRLAVRHAIRDSHYVFHSPPPPPRLPYAYLSPPDPPAPEE